VGRRFGFEQHGPSPASGISKARPDEVKYLVHSNQPQVAGFSSELRFEYDFPAADEGSGMHRDAPVRRAGEQLAAMRGEVWKNFDRYGGADERRKTGGGGANMAAGRCVNASADLEAEGEAEERKRPEPVFGETGFWGLIRWQCQKTRDPEPGFYTCRVPA